MKQSKQERQDNKSGKTCGSGVALTECHETARKVNTIIGQCKHCGQNDHRRKSSTLCPFFEGKRHSSTGTRTINDDQIPVVETEPASTLKNDTCASNQANQMEVSKQFMLPNLFI